MVNFEDWKKIELKVARVISAERIEGSEKLLHLVVSTGEEKRQIIAGIGKTYEPEKLVDKQIIIVANLEPKSLMGIESQGMVVAATNEEGRPTIIIPESPVLDGTVLT
jgi:methionine--tRNA ligase beta chain